MNNRELDRRHQRLAGARRHRRLPGGLLDDRSRSFYRPDGRRALGKHLRPGGVFGLWSNEQPDGRFLGKRGIEFPDVQAAPVSFHNPLQDSVFTRAVYLARTGGADAS